jgi:peptidoglycan/LPS O-acetylase OafA/YrhL
LYSVLFGIIILNLATNQKSTINLENKAMKYLGDISFGLYMYHPIAIAIALLILNSMGNFSNILLYPLVFALTIATASISYTYFESYFLKIKNKLFWVDFTIQLDVFIVVKVIILVWLWNHILCLKMMYLFVI